MIISTEGMVIHVVSKMLIHEQQGSLSLFFQVMPEKGILNVFL